MPVRLLGALVVASALAVGCGGSEAQEDTEPQEGTGRVAQNDDGNAEALTRAELISEADAICRRYAKRPPDDDAFERIHHLRTEDPPAYISSGGLGKLYGQEGRKDQKKADALRRLKPAPEDAPQWQAVLEGLQELVNLTFSLSGAGTRGDQQAMSTLFEEADRQVQRLGRTHDGIRAELLSRPEAATFFAQRRGRACSIAPSEIGADFGNAGRGPANGGYWAGDVAGERRGGAPRGRGVESARRRPLA